MLSNNSWYNWVQVVLGHPKQAPIISALTAAQYLRQDEHISLVLIGSQPERMLTVSQSN